MDRSPSSPAMIVPLLLLFMVGGLWGFFFVLIKTGVTGGLSPMNYLFWFSIIAGSVSFVIGRFRGTRPRFGRDHMGFYVKASLTRFTFANILLYAAQGKLPVGVMAVVMAFTPIFTYAVSLVLRIERIVLLRFLGIMLGFAGVLLIVVPKSSLPDPALAFWVLAGFGVPLMHGLGYVVMDESHRPINSDSLSLATGTLFTNATMTAVLILLFDDFQLLAPPFSLGELAMMTHGVIAGVNFYAMFELIRIAGPTYMSQASSLAVGFGVLYGMVLLGERHSLWVWAAIVLILAGVALVNMRKAGRRNTET
jgi:drug/metabolite transporter (DMT)-like permease